MLVACKIVLLPSPTKGSPSQLSRTISLPFVGPNMFISGILVASYWCIPLKNGHTTASRVNPS